MIPADLMARQSEYDTQMERLEMLSGELKEQIKRDNPAVNKLYQAFKSFVNADDV